MVKLNRKTIKSIHSRKFLKLLLCLDHEEIISYNSVFVALFITGTN